MYADMPSDEGAELASLACEVLKVLADPSRLRIAWLLTDGEHSVGQLASSLNRPASSVSQHLAKMRIARLVTTRRDGTTVYYRITDAHVSHLVTEIAHHAEHMISAVPAHHRRQS